VVVLGLHHVELRVRNLADSTAFLCDVFGLRRQDVVPPCDKTCVCVGMPASEGASFGIVLSEGLPPGTELAGLDHVGVRVATEQDVRDTYAKARALGYRATEPRVFGGAFQTFVFEPSGYKIEVCAQGDHSANGRNPLAQ